MCVTRACVDWYTDHTGLVSSKRCVSLALDYNLKLIFCLYIHPFRCPWIVLIGITSLTNLSVMKLMPWVNRDLYSHPTRCSYVTCSILGYYEAFGQLIVAVRSNPG